MAKLPVLKLRKICKALELAGFVFVRQEGSHMTYVKRGSDRTYVITVPNYPEIDRFILLSIIKQSGATREEFLRLLDLC
ncbi:MAG TPA: type II toxin-antitoxin system HicA family toxin [archaeon]|nr:type II toxin-antitoxin system HicA family toxin [archaeon]